MPNAKIGAVLEFKHINISYKIHIYIYIHILILFGAAKNPITVNQQKGSQNP